MQLRAKWKELRAVVFKRDGHFCRHCSTGPTHDNPLHIDHVKPRSKFPELALDISNLRVLCSKCNISKSDGDEVKRDIGVRYETLLSMAQGSLLTILHEVSQSNPYFVINPDQGVLYLLTEMSMDRMVLLKFKHAFEADSTFGLSQAYQMLEKRLDGKYLEDEEPF